VTDCINKGFETIFLKLLKLEKKAVDFPEQNSQRFSSAFKGNRIHLHAGYIILDLRRLATVFSALECISRSQNPAQKINFDFLDTTPPFQNMIKVCFLTGFLATAVTIATVMDNPSF